jgi:hypothetical protein
LESTNIKFSILFLFFAASSSIAADLSDDVCDRWAENRNRESTVSVNDFTLERAEDALRRISEHSLDADQTFRSRRREVDAEHDYLIGYLLKNELISARKNREHDADEFVALCRHWSRMNFGTPDYSDD